MNFLEERWLRIRETTGIHKYDPKDKPAEREVKGVIFFKKEKKEKKRPHAWSGRRRNVIFHFTSWSDFRDKF